MTAHALPHALHTLHARPRPGRLPAHPASATYSCSLYCMRLQPPSHTVAASTWATSCARCHRRLPTAPRAAPRGSPVRRLALTLTLTLALAPTLTPTPNPNPTPNQVRRLCWSRVPSVTPSSTPQQRRRRRASAVSSRVCCAACLTTSCWRRAGRVPRTRWSSGVAHCRQFTLAMLVLFNP